MDTYVLDGMETVRIQVMTLEVSSPSTRGVTNCIKRLSLSLSTRACVKPLVLGLHGLTDWWMTPAPRATRIDWNLLVNGPEGDPHPMYYPIPITGSGYRIAILPHSARGCVHPFTSYIQVSTCK